MNIHVGLHGYVASFLGYTICMFIDFIVFWYITIIILCALAYPT